MTSRTSALGWLCSCVYTMPGWPACREANKGLVRVLLDAAPLPIDPSDKILAAAAHLQAKFAARRLSESRRHTQRYIC